MVRPALVERNGKMKVRFYANAGKPAAKAAAKPESAGDDKANQTMNEFIDGITG